MRNISKLDPLPDDLVREFIRAGKVRGYDPGEVIIKEGDYDCWVYLLIKGKIEIIKNGKHLRYLQRNGDMFGEMGVIDGSSRSATIKACTETFVVGIDGAIIDNKLKNNELAFCYIIYRLFAEVLAARLRETTEENMQLCKTLSKRGQRG